MTSTSDGAVSRRRLLDAVGTVGAAATLGGASSLAAVTDEEAFANSGLTAGELDLTVGWAEYYTDRSFAGSLAQFLALATAGDGVALDGGPATAFDEARGDPAAAARDCFAAAPVTHALGLRWALPVDHGNELQGDSVGFDFGFYAEQCRHNDGAGCVQ